MSQPTPPSFDNSYIGLPAACYTRQNPEPVPTPQLIKANTELAQQLGIDPRWLESDAGIAALAGNAIAPGSEPVATVYAGHQFGSWNPQLGDGRALLLGEVIGSDGQRYDIQLKGSGRTPYSRGGDGKAPLGPVLREYLVSEAMYRLGVPTTRSLAAIATGEHVYREQALPGAVLTRVARSHIRIGTLQCFAARGDIDTLTAVVEHVIARHYPQAALTDHPILAMLEAIVGTQASLVAQWQMLGFIHGVMNTDNMLLSGETIDYGPCAFMDQYDPATVYSSIDHGGRYAYGNQPGIAHWNLAMLAQALLPLLDDDPEQAVALAQTAVDLFPEKFVAAWRTGMGRKLGIAALTEADDEFAQDLLTLMQEQHADFTLTFRRLAEIAGDAPPAVSVAALFDFDDAWEGWLQRWRQRLAQDNGDAALRQRQMLSANPALTPRNHRVQAALAAADRGDYTLFDALHEVLSRPFDPVAADIDYAAPPRPKEVVRQTFCGT